MDKMNFIKCSDRETIDMLRKSGFQEIANDGKVVTFINNGKLTFENKNIVYTNNLTM